MTRPQGVLPKANAHSKGRPVTHARHRGPQRRAAMRSGCRARRRAARVRPAPVKAYATMGLQALVRGARDGRPNVEEATDESDGLDGGALGEGEARGRHGAWLGGRRGALNAVHNPSCGVYAPPQISRQVRRCWRRERALALERRPGAPVQQITRGRVGEGGLNV